MATSSTSAPTFRVCLHRRSARQRVLHELDLELRRLMRQHKAIMDAIYDPALDALPWDEMGRALARLERDCNDLENRMHAVRQQRDSLRAVTR